MKKLTATDLAARLARPAVIAAIAFAAQQAHADVYAGNLADLDTPQAAYDAGFALGFASAQNNSLAVWGDNPDAPYGGTFGEGVVDGANAANAANSNPASPDTPPGVTNPDDPDDPGDPGDPGDDGDGGGCGCSCGCG